MAEMLLQLLALLYFSLSAVAVFADQILDCRGRVFRQRMNRFEVWARQPISGKYVPPPLRLDLPVLIVGAGPAGLPAMRALTEAGIPWEAVERQSEVGGVWNPHNALSPAYENLRTNSSKSTTHLGDPMPAHWPAYPSRHLAWEYLTTYTDRHNLRSQIRFETEITSSEEMPDGSWKVSLGGKEHFYSAVILASGFHDKTSRIIPEGLWTQAERAGIRCMHGSDYFNAAPFKGERVLVVGIGNTGAEVATEVSAVAKTYLAVRTTPWIVPEYVFGIPADEFAQPNALTRLIPHKAQMLLFHILQWLYVGRRTSGDFPPFNHDLLEKLPIADRGIVDAIASGRIEIQPNVVAFDKGRAVFENGKSVAIDRVIFATGYKMRYPYLPERWREPPEEPSYFMFHPDSENLIYMYEVGVAQGVWPMFARQGKMAARYLQAQRQNTSNYRRFQELKQTPNPDFKGHIFLKAEPRFVDPEIYGDTFLPALGDWIVENP